MRCIDFEYDGQHLSDYGCMVCTIGRKSGVETANATSQLTLNTVHMTGFHKHKIISTQYDSTYTITFQIAKSKCKNKTGNTFNQWELSALMRWLNRKEYHKLKVICENGENANIYYMGTFNIQMLCFGGNVIGLELTFQADAPFGYYEPSEYYMELADTKSKYILRDNSDEAGYLYPKTVEIECLKAGDMTISNSKDMKQTVIKNCAAGEIITLDGENKLIYSSMEHSKLCNDFNYHFIRIINEQNKFCDNNENIFTSSLPCNIRLIYSPICKVGVIS